MSTMWDIDNDYHAGELLELTIDKQYQDIIDKLLDVELDTFSKIIEDLKDLPYLKQVLGFCRIGFGIVNLCHVRKIARFIKASGKLSDIEKDRYLSSLSKKDKSRISGFLTNLLFLFEDEYKAEIMGQIYSARVRNEINDEEMLRLCSVLNRLFITDLDYLGIYTKPNNYNGYITDNLYAAGLLEQLSSVEESGIEEELLSVGVRKYQLNKMGDILFKILSKSSGTE